MRTYFIKMSNLIGSLAREVWLNLGNGFTREIYADALEAEFLAAGVPFERDKSVVIPYKDTILKHSYTADFLVNDKIILRIAAEKAINDTEWRELASILRASKLNLGIYINYSYIYPEFKRVVVSSKFINSNNIINIKDNPHELESSMTKKIDFEEIAV